jgi:hypothetical protein
VAAAHAGVRAARRGGQGPRQYHRRPAEPAGQLEHLPGLIRAADGAERQQIRRAENAVVVRQLLAWWQDLGQELMPGPPVFPFSCECEFLGCERVVPLPVTEYQRRRAAGPVTAADVAGLPGR